jgi:hypothetical protein
LDKQKISKEKALFLSIAIVTVALLIAVLGILLMPNIKGLFHKSSMNEDPQSYVFTENDKTIKINTGDDFEIRFQSTGVIEEGEGWTLLSNYSQSKLSLMEGVNEPSFQVWKFYGKARGTTVLNFQNGYTTKDFTVIIN